MEFLCAPIRQNKIYIPHMYKSCLLLHNHGILLISQGDVAPWSQTPVKITPLATWETAAFHNYF